MFVKHGRKVYAMNSSHKGRMIRTIAPCGLICDICLGLQREKNKCAGCTNTGYKPFHCDACRIKLCAECDCEDCIDSTESIVYFRGNCSQIYCSGGGLKCQVEDTTGMTVHFRLTVVFRPKMKPIEKQRNKE